MHLIFPFWVCLVFIVFWREFFSSRYLLSFAIRRDPLTAKQTKSKHKNIQLKLKHYAVFVVLEFEKFQVECHTHTGDKSLHNIWNALKWTEHIIKTLYLELNWIKLNWNEGSEKTTTHTQDGWNRCEKQFWYDFCSRNKCKKGNSKVEKRKM